MGALNKILKRFGPKKGKKAPKTSTQPSTGRLWPKGGRVFEENTKTEGTLCADYREGDKKVCLKVKGRRVSIDNPDLTEVHLTPAERDAGQQTLDELRKARK